MLKWQFYEFSKKVMYNRNIHEYYNRRDAKTIVKFYKARYQMEFNFRDAKQLAGLNHCQARDKSKLDFHFNASLTSVNIAKKIARNGVEKEQNVSLSIEDVKTELSNKCCRLFLSNFEIDPK